MSKLDEIEKRIVKKASPLHPISAIHLDDAEWLIARLRKAQAALDAIQEASGCDLANEDPLMALNVIHKTASDFLAKLEE